MRNRFFTIFLLTFFWTSATCQVYTPMVVDHARWIYGGFGELNLDRFGVEILGDTIFQGLEYKKVYHLNLESGKPTDPVVVKNKHVISLLREDTVAQKVYCISWGAWTQLSFIEYCEENHDQIEFLLYDFSVQVGDTLNTCLGVFEEGPSIQQTDVLDIYYDTHFGYALNTRLCESDAHLIDGIGFELGLFQHAIKFIHAAKGYSLTTYCREEDVNECLPSSTINQHFDNFVVYPNPVHDVISVKSDEPFDHLRLYDALGELLFQKDVLASYYESISLNGIEKGLLVLEVSNSEGKSIVKKIMLQ